MAAPYIDPARQLAEIQLGRHRLDILGRLYDNGPTKFEELVGVADIKPEALSKMLQAMQKSGLVDLLKVSNPDRDVTTVSLTPIGEVQMKQWVDSMRNILGPIPSPNPSENYTIDPSRRKN